MSGLKNHLAEDHLLKEVHPQAEAHLLVEAHHQDPQDLVDGVKKAPKEKTRTRKEANNHFFVNLRLWEINRAGQSFGLYITSYLQY